MKIKDLMSKNFSVLPDRLSPLGAREQLGDDEFGVVIGEEGTPHSVLTAQDIRVLARLGAEPLCKLGAELPPTIMVEFESELSLQQLKRLADSGSRGVVVLDDAKKVAGVVPCQFVLYSNMASISGDLGMIGSASALGGDPNTGPARLKCLSPGCGFVNEIHYLDYYNLPFCRNESLPSHRFIFQT